MRRALPLSLKRNVILLGTVLLLAVVAAAVWYGPAQAQAPQQGYTLDWWTVDGGGTHPAGGSGYSLGGTAGQPDAGLWSGGGYLLGGGFWGGGAVVVTEGYRIYLPLVTRGQGG